MAASVAMMAIVTSSSMSVKPRRARSTLDDTRDLLDGREASDHLRPAVRTQRDEAACMRERPQLGARCTDRDRVSTEVVHREELEEADAPAIAGASTLPASSAMRQLGNRIFTHEGDHVARRLVRFATRVTDAAHQALCQHALQRCREEILWN